MNRIEAEYRRWLTPIWKAICSLCWCYIYAVGGGNMARGNLTRSLLFGISNVRNITIIVLRLVGTALTERCLCYWSLFGLASMYVVWEIDFRPCNVFK